MSCQDEEDQQQPETLGHSIRMLAPREGQAALVMQLLRKSALCGALPEDASDDQKYNFKANWISRGSLGLSRVDPISPKVELVKLPEPDTATTPFPPKLGWLKLG